MPADMSLVIAELASEMGLVPLAWLGVMYLRGKRPGAEWFWLAGAFAVSWIADTAARWADPFLIGAVYPLMQSALVGAVFLFRRDAMKLVVILMLVGIVDVFWTGVEGPDILLRTVAWLAVVGIVSQLPQLGRLRLALVVYFGLGWLCWMLYANWPGWWTYGAYQVTRLLGILLFCWAATSPTPHLKLSRN